VDYSPPASSKARVDRAGVALGFGDADEEDLQVINNWRSAHAYPLHSSFISLKNKAKAASPGALVSQRIKRLPSIQTKLKRYPKMRLSQMQDIGGDRAVVGTLAKVYELQQAIMESPGALKYITEDNYLIQPKDDGYRSLHLIFKYSAAGDSPYNGLWLELQLRSRLQHAWATALETVDFLHSQALKLGGGTQEWRRFFSLMGSYIAIREEAPLVPNTPKSESTICEELRTLSAELLPEERLQAFNQVVQRSGRLSGSRYFLLELDVESKRLDVRGFEDFKTATDQYIVAENTIAVTNARRNKEAVLVSVDKLASLKEAYPNFYLNTSDFLKVLRKALA
jgi:hypothetical protein